MLKLYAVVNVLDFQASHLRLISQNCHDLVAMSYIRKWSRQPGTPFELASWFTQVIVFMRFGPF